VNSALRSCIEFRSRQLDVAAPGDALLVGGETATSLVQRELAEGLQPGQLVKNRAEFKKKEMNLLFLFFEKK
jgi:hypothetical protein